MTVTQTEIVTRLAELSRLLDKATVEIAELDEAAVRAKSTYETTFARGSPNCFPYRGWIWPKRGKGAFFYYFHRSGRDRDI